MLSIVLFTGGLHNAVSVATQLGARAFSLFLTSSRTWNTKPLTDADADRFIAAYTVPMSFYDICSITNYFHNVLLSASRSKLT